LRKRANIRQGSTTTIIWTYEIDNYNLMPMR
jgi:hypothetical protein